MRIKRCCLTLAALALIALAAPQVVASQVDGECAGAEELNLTPDQVIDALVDQGLEVEPVSGGGSHPDCPVPRSCGDLCIAGVCGPLVFPPQCSQQDLGDNSCTVGARTIRVCPKGQTIHTSTCECRDISPCICGNRVTVSCQ